MKISGTVENKFLKTIFQNFFIFRGLVSRKNHISTSDEAISVLFFSCYSEMNCPWSYREISYLRTFLNNLIHCREL